jgi:hypothetical protein
MRAWLARLFPNWTAFAEYLAFLAACVGGIVGSSWWVGIFLPALLLTLLSWPRWRGLVGKAGKLDAEWRDLGALALQHRQPGWFEYYARAYKLPLVIAVKFGHDTLFSAAAYIFGIVIGWIWECSDEQWARSLGVRGVGETP